MRVNNPDGGRLVTPLVSVVMANYQAGDKLVPAMESVLAQSIGALELIVCDDASTDHSVSVVERIMQRDARVSLIRAECNGGPARCRNRGLNAARGTWIAIVDADDAIHPERFERLLAAAEYTGADIVADDLLHFFEDGSPARLLLGPEQDKLFPVPITDWINSGLNGSPPLGYLKPMIRADRLGQLRYDESLRIGEDYDLVLRLLLGGAGMVVMPEPYYLYRRHTASISHRLSVADLATMIESQDALAVRLSSMPPDIEAAFAAKRAQLLAGLQFERLVSAIKQRRLPEALGQVLRNPRLMRPLWRSFAEGRTQRAGGKTATRIRHDAIALGPSGITVPDYIAPDQVNWSAPSQRQTWLRLADLARGQSVDVGFSDAASRYAAGFVPLARLIEPNPNRAPGEVGA